VKQIIKNWKTIIFLAKANLKKENKATSLGYLWLVISPLITSITFGVIFGMIFNSTKDGIDYFPWYVAGYYAWSFISDAFMNGTFSIVNNKNLVTKLVFPLELLPVIEFVKGFYKFLILLVLTVIILAIYGIYPTIYWLQLIYCVIATFFFIYGITKFMATLVVIFRDIGNFINAIMQMLFWASGVIWSTTEIGQNYPVAVAILKLNPFLYLVETYRNAFLSRAWFWNNLQETIIFWIITIIFIILGNYVFKKNRDDFADLI